MTRKSVLERWDIMSKYHQQELKSKSQDKASEIN